MDPLIFLLNLDRRQDRAEYMDDQLQGLGLGYQRFSALDGKSAPDEAFRERVVAGPKSIPMARGSQAIAVSTFRIFAQLCTSDAPFGLILQDDMELSPDLPRYMADLSWAPPGVGLLQLEHLGRDPTTKLLGPSKPSLQPGRQLHLMRDRHLGAGCFLISRDFARQLLADNPILDMPVDEYLFNPAVSEVPTKAQAHVMIPALARQRRDLLGSDLTPERDKLRAGLKSQTLSHRLKRELGQAAFHARGVLRGDRLAKVGYKDRA